MEGYGEPGVSGGYNGGYDARRDAAAILRATLAARRERAEAEASAAEARAAAERAERQARRAEAYKGPRACPRRKVGAREGAILRRVERGRLPDTWRLDGEAVRAARRVTGWNRDVAAARYGASGTLWSFIELGHMRGNETAARELAAALGVPETEWRRFIRVDDDAPTVTSARAARRAQQVGQVGQVGQAGRRDGSAA